MDLNSLPPGLPAGASAGRAPVSRKMVQARTRELALIADRVPPHVSQGDYEQAKRELTGESDGDRQAAILDAMPEGGHVPPPAGPTGRTAPASPHAGKVIAPGRERTP